MPLDEKEILTYVETLARARKEAILHSPDEMHITGKTYYVQNDGNDENDGLSPQTAWKTLARVSRAELCPGDGVLFCRGDVFRGFVETKPHVTYAAYGTGKKPEFYGWDKSLADPALWSIADETHHIWRLNESILDCGTLVFNDGEAHCRKLIPSYIDGKFVCRDDESLPFSMPRDMTHDLDMVCFYDERLTTRPSKGKDFPVPVIDGESFGSLYLRCDKGNPGTVFAQIEALPKRNMFFVRSNPGVKIDNLCIKYVGAHAIGGGCACLEGLHVTNCEIGWVGGTVQHYFGTDPNYPEGSRGSVTRFGNAIEIYGGCHDYLVSGCYIYQVYDAGITHQLTTRGEPVSMTEIRYTDNLIEDCVYSIEYFLEKTQGDTESYIADCEISRNILRRSGFGWGQQRHNVHTPAHIKGWNYENTAQRFFIDENIFDRAAYRMLHLVAEDEKSCPVLDGNTFIQTEGQMLGQYGGRHDGIPPMLAYDQNAEQTVKTVLGDQNAKVYFLK